VGELGLGQKKKNNLANRAVPFWKRQKQIKQGFKTLPFIEPLYLGLCDGLFPENEEDERAKKAGATQPNKQTCTFRATDGVLAAKHKVAVDVAYQHAAKQEKKSIM
jgi:hypothetical protein